MSLAIELTKPGVTAVVNKGQVARPLDRQPTSTFFAIGFASWGEIGVRKTVTSWAEYLRVFGGYHSLGYLAESAYIFFNHFGGKQMVIVRAGENEAKASVTVNNRVDPVAVTFQFDAKHASKTVDVAVSVSDNADPELVDLTIVSKRLGIVERYSADLRITEERTKINSSSKLVDISLAASAVAGPNGRPEAGTFALVGGDDGSAGMTSSDMAGFISQFEDETLGTGQIAIPGHYAPENTVALQAHAESYNRLALLESALGEDYQDVADAFNATPSTYSAAYFPWVQMQDVSGSGQLKFYPPTIFAAGACAKVDRTIGTHKAPANITVPLALDVEKNADGTSVINDGVREYLNGKHINVIAPLPGEGIKIYGARVLYPAGETRVKFVHERRILNLIYYTAKIGYAWAVFAVVDGTGRLFRDLRSSGETFLRNLWRAGALFGKTESEAFIVLADDSNNPPEELEQGRVNVQIGVKLSPTAEVIFINIDSVPLSQDLDVLNGGEG